MKASEVIKQLQSLMDEYGDLEVTYDGSMDVGPIHYQEAGPYGLEAGVFCVNPS